MVRPILVGGFEGGAHLLGDVLVTGYLCEVYRRCVAETTVHRSLRSVDDKADEQPSGLSATLVYALSRNARLVEPWWVCWAGDLHASVLAACGGLLALRQPLGAHRLQLVKLSVSVLGFEDVLSHTHGDLYSLRDNEYHVEKFWVLALECS